jgi:hypothetical protein
MPSCLVCRGPMRILPFVPSWLSDVYDFASKTCSIRCLAILSTQKDKMIPTETQKQEAIVAASKAAGAFIVATRSFDLKRISRDRWLRLLRIIAETYAEELAKSCDGISTALVKEQEFDDEIPF